MTTTELCQTEECDREIRDTAYVCDRCGDRLRRLLAMLGDSALERPRVLEYPHLPEHRCADCGTGIEGHPVRNELRETGLPLMEPGLVADLERAMSKLGSTWGTSDGPTRSPYGYRSAEARWTLRDTMTRAGDEIARIRGLFRPYNSLPALGAWLSTQVDWMRHQPQGAELIDELTACMREGLRAIDNSAKRLLIGACDATIPDEQGMSIECGEQLYAREYDVEVECSRCGTRHKTRDTWDRMLDKSEDLLMTRTEIALALAGWGYKISPKRLENWATRGRLLRRGLSTGRPARPLYRLGDVRDLLGEDRATTA